MLDATGGEQRTRSALKRVCTRLARLRFRLNLDCFTPSMKIITGWYPVLLLGLGLGLAASWVGAAPAASPPPRIPPERADVKVLKVFSATDEGHVFRAYLVEWKGQEVIVDDRLVKTTYAVGDTLTVLVMKLPHPDKTVEHALLHFTVVPPRNR